MRMESRGAMSWIGDIPRPDAAERRERACQLWIGSLDMKGVGTMRPRRPQPVQHHPGNGYQAFVILAGRLLADNRRKPRHLGKSRSPIALNVCPAH